MNQSDIAEIIDRARPIYQQGGISGAMYPVQDVSDTDGYVVSANDWFAIVSALTRVVETRKIGWCSEHDSEIVAGGDHCQHWFAVRSTKRECHKVEGTLTTPPIEKSKWKFGR